MSRRDNEIEGRMVRKLEGVRRGGVRKGRLHATVGKRGK